MSVLSNNEKLENYLDELADEYKKLLYKALISRTKSIDDLSVSELLRLDNEIKQPLFEEYHVKQHRRRILLIAGFTYMFIGVFSFLFSKIIFGDYQYNEENIITLISVIIAFVGFIIIVYLFTLQALNIRTPTRNLKNEESSQILEYEIVRKWRELEGIVNDISINSQIKTPRSIIQFLTENQFIDDEKSNVLKNFLKIRNNIVHSTNNSYTATELKTMLNEIDKIINKIKKIV